MTSRVDGLSPPSRSHLSPPPPRLLPSTRDVGGEPRGGGCLARAYVLLLKSVYTANIAAIATTNTATDIPSTAPVDSGELVCKAAEEDVGLVRCDDESVIVITGLLGSRGLVTEGTGKPVGPSNKLLLSRPTDEAVVPPVTPEAEGTAGTD